MELRNTDTTMTLPVIKTTDKPSFDDVLHCTDTSSSRMLARKQRHELKARKKDTILFWTMFVLCIAGLTVLLRVCVVSPFRVPTGSMIPTFPLNTRLILWQPLFLQLIQTLSQQWVLSVIGLGSLVLILVGVSMYLNRHTWISVIAFSVSFLCFLVGGATVHEALTHHSTINRGDVIVFHDTNRWSGASGKSILTKRVIAVGGDTVDIENDGVYVNNKRLDEKAYAVKNTTPYQPLHVKVPDGRVFVMGDNRDHSADSRSHTSNPRAMTVSEKDIIGKPLVHFRIGG